MTRRLPCCLALAGLLAAMTALGGCANWRTRGATAGGLPTSNRMDFEQLVVYSNSPLPAKHRLLAELDSQRAAVNGKLALPPSDEKIHVYLFGEAALLHTYVHAHWPDFPDRRAMFIETDTRLEVYAYWGDRVAEDLRHEVAHGYLHSVVPRIALWIDEGLAEYFEVPPGRLGLNDGHVVQLADELKTGWQPNLVRLENLPSAAEMNQRDYAEAWAWAHLLLETTPDRLAMLQAYLSDVRTGGSSEPMSSRLAKAEPQAATLAK